VRASSSFAALTAASSTLLQSPSRSPLRARERGGAQKSLAGERKKLGKKKRGREKRERERERERGEKERKIKVRQALADAVVDGCVANSHLFIIVRQPPPPLRAREKKEIPRISSSRPNFASGDTRSSRAMTQSARRFDAARSRNFNRFGQSTAEWR